MANKESKGMRSWPHYVVEFLVILLGITVSVTIEKNNAREYKENVKNQSLARILTNIRQDSIDFNFNIAVHEPAHRSCTWMLERRDRLAEEHPDSVGRHCSMCVMGQTIFVDNQEEYRTLQNSGLMELIENDSLARALQGKYVEHEFLRKIENSINESANISIEQYFSTMETTPDMEYHMGYIPLKRWTGEPLPAAYLERIGMLQFWHEAYAIRMGRRQARDAELSRWIRTEIAGKP